MERANLAAGSRRVACAGGNLTRIVSGVWGGRRLVVPSSRRVRPTAERVREAWLNILSPELAGAAVVDLCAGSGALGLEALSRGAAHATFVETHPDSLTALRSNIADLEATARTTVRRIDAVRFVAGLGAGSYHVALADPPFASDIAEQLVRAWQAVPFAPVLAIEHAHRTALPGGTTRRWGDIAVTFYRAS
ncbi:MAG: 16S rRNA (guanine(966)-N(2))-methyltransferase RsmD [Gemmatimonadales bacterium]